MNISTKSTNIETPQPQANDTQANPPVEKKPAVDTSSKENKEDTNNQQSGDFHKLLEPKDTDKISMEQALPQNMQNMQNLENANYVSKFGFDTISDTKKFSSLYNYDTVKISKDDAKFFADLVDNKQFAMQDVNSKNQLIKFSDGVSLTYKTQQTSTVLNDLITKAYNDQKPVRIDFDNNVSVILKVDKKGKVSAEFIPGDKAVEEYLRNNIGFLKQRLDDKNISYNDIMYRHSKQQNQQNENNNRKKDNEGE